ncbi:NAD(P)-dependent dehydrogenase, short-chain alcohol dehydrogenase family [Paenibacillus sp. 1_12]|uniref:SDR family oxidoreductase n=1 Tax=Paenibacillus sp. 1_12 TaxID=1566278 RepID=UPI0008EA3A1D|nr:SDR family oxidoreductase [Paenibacillus sp. 1_12]SFM39037.1 NAD(P)-dependent dehydrogenase, short-chain alcohol dehydrogenase family [Paenibacillus sp. 1_12]
MTKFAFVTGADRGLGYELVLQLLNRQYTVFAGRYLRDWDQLHKAVPEYDGRLIVMDLDVSDEASVQQAASVIKGHTSKLDVVINNAGIGGRKDDEIFGEIDFNNIIQLFNVNALGPLRVTQAILPLLMNGEDKLLVNISSEAGQINQTWREGWYGYCMSKAALNIQSNLVHNQLKNKGGRVLVIHPGWMKTYMSGKLNDSADVAAEEAASQIIETLLQYQENKEVLTHPAFLNYKAEEMSW